MEKLPALILAVLITFFLAFNFFMLKDFGAENEIVIIARIIDGDTVVLDDGRTIRLLNINAPEKNTFGSSEGANFLKKYVNKTLSLENAGVEKYGRTLGRIYGPEYLNLELVKLGFSSIFLVDDKEISIFYKAQEKAISQGLGMWHHSQHYGCLKPSEINKEYEFVILEKTCDVSIKGWVLKDESTKTYKFKKDFEGDFKLWSDKGTENEKNVYWNSGNVWNNDRDSLFIRDAEGKLVYYESYGY